jgi:cytoskeletal protein CcmA (bactofilin family)
MAAEITVIGKGARIRGKISGTATLEINGHVEGEIEVDGDLTVGDSGTVGSDLSGRRVVVRGAVKGDVAGQEVVVLEDGAKVVGDIRAPRIAIAPGALIRGYVETSGAGASRPRAVPAARSSSTNVARAKPSVVKPAPASAAAHTPQSPGIMPRGAALAGARPQGNHAPPAKKAPPPPVVPALKKGAKGALAKKR